MFDNDKRKLEILSLESQIRTLEYKLSTLESNLNFVGKRLDMIETRGGKFTSALMKQLKLRTVDVPPQDGKITFEKIKETK